jgi:hypothetical protein
MPLSHSPLQAINPGKNNPLLDEVAGLYFKMFFDHRPSGCGQALNFAARQTTKLTNLQNLAFSTRIVNVREQLLA